MGTLRALREEIERILEEEGDDYTDIINTSEVQRWKHPWGIIPGGETDTERRRSLLMTWNKIPYQLKGASELIRKTRIKRGWTQQTLADEAGIHPVALSRIETGKVNMKTETLLRIADALEIHPMILLGGEAFEEIEHPEEFIYLWNKFTALTNRQQGILRGMLDELFDPIPF